MSGDELRIAIEQETEAQFQETFASDVAAALNEILQECATHNVYYEDKAGLLANFIGNKEFEKFSAIIPMNVRNRYKNIFDSDRPARHRQAACLQWRRGLGKGILGSS